MNCILYNPYANNGHGLDEAKGHLEGIEGEKNYVDITKITDFKAFFGEIPATDKVIICGGDGTLNCFVNKVDEELLERDIYYFPGGNGNDFCNDINHKKTDGLVLVSPYLRNLPTVTLQGVTMKFIDNVAMGIDGYVCEKGDEQKKKSTKTVNYTKIAVQGLLYAYKPGKASVTVDGVKRDFEHVWMIPSMKGRFYGGGMMVAPMQDRNREDRKLTVVVVHAKSKFDLLKIFPKIFTGEHAKYPKQVEFFTGSHVVVEFEKPTPVQVDGEVFHDVYTYEASI